MDACSNAASRCWWSTACSGCRQRRVTAPEAGVKVRGPGGSACVKYVPPCSVDEIKGFDVGGGGGIIIIFEGATGTGESAGASP